MLRVEDTKAGKAIAAYIILDLRLGAGDLRHGAGALADDPRVDPVVGKINVHYGDSGRVTVNLWDWTGRDEGSGTNYQEAHAGGYGYDKLTAALAGLTFGGVKLYDHCERSELTDQAMAEYLELVGISEPALDFPDFFTKWESLGVRFANYSSERRRYTDAYMIPGLQGIEARGFKVVQAI